jgi:hypothetical protein
MGPPVNHGVFLVPGRIPIPVESRSRTRIFRVLGEFFAIRFKELNTYSGRLTRWFTTVSGRFAESELDAAQDGLIPDCIAGSIEMDAIRRSGNGD